MNIDKLNRLYNTMLAIETRGESTLLMSACLNTLREIIQEASVAGATKESK